MISLQHLPVFGVLTALLTSPVYAQSTQLENLLGGAAKQILTQPKKSQGTSAKTNPSGSRSEKAAIQQALNDAGYSVGVADGIFGPKTRDGIRRWQRDNGFEATGTLTAKQRDRLLGRTDPAAAAAIAIGTGILLNSMTKSGGKGSGSGGSGSGDRATTIGMDGGTSEEEGGTGDVLMRGDGSSEGGIIEVPAGDDGDSGASDGVRDKLLRRDRSSEGGIVVIETGDGTSDGEGADDSTREAAERLSRRDRSEGGVILLRPDEEEGGSSEGSESLEHDSDGMVETPDADRTKTRIDKACSRYDLLRLPCPYRR